MQSWVQHSITQGFIEIHPKDYKVGATQRSRRLFLGCIIFEVKYLSPAHPSQWAAVAGIFVGKMEKHYGGPGSILDGDLEMKIIGMFRICGGVCKPI